MENEHNFLMSCGFGMISTAFQIHVGVSLEGITAMSNTNGCKIIQWNILNVAIGLLKIKMQSNTNLCSSIFSCIRSALYCLIGSLFKLLKLRESSVYDVSIRWRT